MKVKHLEPPAGCGGGCSCFRRLWMRWLLFMNKRGSIGHTVAKSENGVGFTRFRSYHRHRKNTNFCVKYKWGVVRSEVLPTFETYFEGKHPVIVPRTMLINISFSYQMVLKRQSVFLTFLCPPSSRPYGIESSHLPIDFRARLSSVRRTSKRQTQRTTNYPGVAPTALLFRRMLYSTIISRLWR